MKKTMQMNIALTVPVKGIAALHKARVLQCTCTLHAASTLCPQSVHTPYMQIHEDAWNYTHVVTRSGCDIACKITHDRPTGTH